MSKGCKLIGRNTVIQPSLLFLCWLHRLPTSNLHKRWDIKLNPLTVYNIDLAPLVMWAQGNSVAFLGCHCVYCPLSVSTLSVGVIIWVVLGQNVFSTAWIQSSLDWVSAIWFVPPSDNGSPSGRCLVITSEGDGLEKDYNVLLGGTLDWDSQCRLWNKDPKNPLSYIFFE